ncbi:membrane protein of ER body-like protein isoform X3 [Coffea eugenioides]|uniref:membrane protein of ER body-like protein isoform X3 n=1 Tax=Coffea eugenioides TaxID=49369 RepID=UPI000F60EDBC|nr:membrane protein of ER body-like protein isoform X3 [Coffea eugenioides]
MEVMQQFRTEVEKKKEVLHHFKEGVEEVVEEALLLRRRSANIPTVAANSGGNATVFPAAEEVAAVDLLDTTPKMEVASVSVDGDQKEVEKTSEEIVYFDKNEGSGPEWSHFNVKVEELGAKLKDVAINQVLSAVIHNKEVKLPTSTNPQLQEETDERVEVDDVLEETSDEEEIELEFERAVERIHTHDDYSMYCPNCSSRITKVVLRRKIRQRRVQTPKETQRDDLFGCLACFSVFIPSAGNRLNPFRIFGAGKGPESSPLLQQEQQTPDVSMPTSVTAQDKGKGFDLFWIFGKRRPHEKLSGDLDSSSPKVTNEPRDQANDQGDGVMTFIPNAIPPVGMTESKVATIGDGVMTFIPNAIPPVGMTESNVATLEIFVKKPKSEIEGDDVRIQVGDTPPVAPPIFPITDVFLTDVRIPETVIQSPSSRSLEIVKSIVYGGMMESIASLSVVSSAAASDATTLNIVALGLANLVGGLVVLAHNLRDLRYGESSETNESRYKEQLGRKEHFFFHATLAVLSYLVFGLIPPVIYGFTFRESDDRDYKILAVAAASLLCIVILAIAKAYTRGEHKFVAYFKTILYYVTSAVLVSGIAYAVGNLVNKLLERLGWLNPATVEPQLFSQAKSFNPTSWASY